MFRAFIDETGNDPREPVFCFGGWIARVDEWERFSDAWKRTLSRKPSIAYFSHNDAMGLKDQFAGWTATERNKKMLSLAKTITRFAIKYGFTTGIRNDVVARFMKQSLPSIKTARSILHISRAYDWSFYSVTAMILQIQVDLKETEKVDFVFDKGDVAALYDCRRVYGETPCLSYVSTKIKLVPSSPLGGGEGAG